jgi:hypothetical protein
MFNGLELGTLGTVAEKLVTAAAKVRWLVWAFAGYWLGRFLVTQDPVELLLAAATLVLVHFGGLLLKVISGASDEDAEAHAAGAAEAKVEEEVVPTRE